VVDDTRRFIFTERERRLLERWLEEGEEDVDVPRIFTWIRSNLTTIREDVELMLRVIRELRRRRRWRGRIRDRSEFGSALRRAESALTRARSARAASVASSG
jgi:hypothetical protein